MDQNQSYPYSTEIPVSEVEKLHAQPTLPAQPVTQSPVMPPTPSRNHHKLLNFVMLAVIIILASWVVILTLGQSSRPVPAQIIPTPTALPTATATPTPTPEASTSADPTSNRFYSQELGIMFDYAKTTPIQNSNKSLLVSTQNNRTYIYLKGSPLANGQFIEVTNKISTDTIGQALGKIINGSSIYAGCAVTSLTNTIYPPTYELTSLTCPTGAGGGGFFLTDSDHPDKLAYISLIQSPLPASETNPEIPWVDTIRFISSSRQ